MLRTILVLNMMSKPVVSIGPDNNLLFVQGLFEEHNINHLPVVDENNYPLGVISKADIDRLLNWRNQFASAAGSARQYDQKLFESMLAEDIMSKPAVTISSEAYVKDAADLIEKNKIHCLPVVDLRGKVIGIVTAHDLLRLAYNQLRGMKN